MKKSFLLLIILVTAISDKLFSQVPGDLDSTFGGDGIVTTDLGTINDVGNSVAIQSDGKIVVAGYSDDGAGDIDFALTRYNTDGTLDSTFNEDGIINTDFGIPFEFALAVAIQSDAKIIAAGYAINLNGSVVSFALARYTTDGNLDTDFGGDGKVVTTGISVLDGICSLAIQPDGKIVIAGSAFADLQFGIALVRFNEDGTVDTSFGAEGTQITHIGNFDMARSIAIQPDGKIVIAGTTSIYPNVDIAVIRYNSDGSLDTSFNTDGIVITNINTVDYGNAVYIQPDGKIVVAGYTFDLNSDIAVIRCNIDGDLDTTFSSDGIVLSDIDGDDYANAMAIEPDGKIVITGTTGYYPDNDLALVRYDLNGALDTSFGTNGIVIPDFGGSYNVITSVAIDLEGKIVVAGIFSNNLSNYDFAVARYISGFDPCFNALTPSLTITATEITATGGTIFQWYLNGEIISGATLQSYTPTESGNYSVLVTDANGCSVLSDEVAFTYTVIEISAKEIFISVYPNPADDFLIIELPTRKEATIQIINLLGQIVFAETINTAQKEIDVSHLPKGMYHVTVIASLQKFESKFLKQ